MKKIKRMLALLVAMVMVMGMTVTASAAKVTNEYLETITVTNLAADVETTVRAHNIIYLDRDDTGNGNWVVVEWAKPYVNEDGGKFVITNRDGLKAAAEARKEGYEEKKTAETTCMFENLPIGAYVITASDTAGTYGLMVANTYNEDDTYLAAEAANVVAKMEGFHVDKEADDKFVHRGEEVTFTVTTKFPAKKDANGNDLTSFVINDHPVGLKITEDMPVVTIGEDKCTITKEMVQNKIDEATGTTTEYRVNLSDFIAGSEAGGTVTVVYKAIVMDDKTYNNQAGADSNTVRYTPSDVVKGFEGNITLTKVNENKTEQLKGAEFQVYKDIVEEGNALYFVKTGDGEYKLALNSEEDGATQTVVTGEAGTVKLTGLDEGLYLLKETKAPEGYALVNDPVKVEIKAGNEDKEVSVETEFMNTKLSSLPETGGIGTTIFTIGGCVIMIAAAGLFFASRRKSAK